MLLSVLFFQEPDQPDTWVAQVLEYDIAAFGKDIQSATRALTQTLRGHVLAAERRNIEPFSTVQKAPDMFWTLWDTVIQSEGKPAVESLPTIPAYMIPAVSHEPVSPIH